MPPKKVGKPVARQLTPQRPAPRRPAPPPLDAPDPGLPVDPAATTTFAPVSAVPAAPRAVPPPRGVPPARPQTAPRAVPPAVRRTTVPPAAGAGLRALRGRVAQQIQTMDLFEEMAWIRSDIVRLALLAGVGFVILIVLAVALPMFGL